MPAAVTRMETVHDDQRVHVGGLPGRALLRRDVKLPVCGRRIVPQLPRLEGRLRRDARRGPPRRHRRSEDRNAQHPSYRNQGACVSSVVSSRPSSVNPTNTTTAPLRRGCARYPLLFIPHSFAAASSSFNARRARFCSRRSAMYRVHVSFSPSRWYNCCTRLSRSQACR